MPLKDKFVRVRSRTLTETVGDEIAGHGFPCDVADRLAARLVRAECLPEGQVREAVRGLLWNLPEEWATKPDSDILTMQIYRRLVDREYGTNFRHTFAEEPWKLATGRSRRFADLCVAEDRFDFTLGLGKTVEFLDRAKDRMRPGLDMAQVLWRQGLVEPERLIDASQLIAIAKSTGISGGSWNSAEEEAIKRDVRAPAFWIAVDPEAAIRGLTPAVTAASDEDLAWLARGINVCEGRSLAISGWTSMPLKLRGVTGWAFDLVDARVGSDPRTCLPLLRDTWLYLWRELWWKYKVKKDPVRDRRLLAAADLELGALRPIVERADPAAFVDRVPALDVAVTCLFELSPLWEGIRRLLLAFRKLPVPGVASDLRWWTDTYHREPPLPQPWHRIAEQLVSSFHTYAKQEQDGDAELTALRTSFSRFCLDRLKTRESGDGPREDNPTWRLGYIQAVVALRINPEGKGHHTLHRAAEHDPHPEVQAAAREAYEVLRHGPKLPAGESPRRSVLLAFWHLRQSHLAALNVPIQERGANRTRDEEVRRTTEQEEHDHKTTQTPAVPPPSEPETGSPLM